MDINRKINEFKYCNNIQGDFIKILCLIGEQLINFVLFLSFFSLWFDPRFSLGFIVF